MASSLNPPARCRFGYARAKLCPRKLAAAEEAVLLLVGRSLAVRFDDGDLGERGLHRRPLRDGVEPAREIRIVLPAYALGVMIARPREGRDVGDRIVLPAEIRHLAKPRLQHLIEAFHLAAVAAERIFVAGLWREHVEMSELTEHGTDAADLEYQPL